MWLVIRWILLPWAVGCRVHRSIGEVPTNRIKQVFAGGAGTQSRRRWAARIEKWESTLTRDLEGMAGLWCTALGYGNKEIIEAAERQMRELSFSHMFGGKTHPSAIELADKLAAMVPMQDGRVFLGNSGSDANDTLLKLIRYHAEASGQPNRIKVIAREQGYHGVTLASQR